MRNSLIVLAMAFAIFTASAQAQDPNILVRHGFRKNGPDYVSWNAPNGQWGFGEYTLSGTHVRDVFFENEGYPIATMPHAYTAICATGRTVGTLDHWEGSVPAVFHSFNGSIGISSANLGTTVTWRHSIVPRNLPGIIGLPAPGVVTAPEVGFVNGLGFLQMPLAGSHISCMNGKGYTMARMPENMTANTFTGEVFEIDFATGAYRRAFTVEDKSALAAGPLEGYGEKKYPEMVEVGPNGNIYVLNRDLSYWGGRQHTHHFVIDEYTPAGVKVKNFFVYGTDLAGYSIALEEPRNKGAWLAVGTSHMFLAYTRSDDSTGRPEYTGYITKIAAADPATGISARVIKTLTIPDMSINDLQIRGNIIMFTASPFADHSRLYFTDTALDDFARFAPAPGSSDIHARKVDFIAAAGVSTPTPAPTATPTPPSVARAPR